MAYMHFHLWPATVRKNLMLTGKHRVLHHICLGTTLFRLYYESVRSKSQEAFGLKQQQILDGIYAIGQLDCRFTHFVHVPE